MQAQRIAGRSRIAAASAARMYQREQPRAAASAPHSVKGRLDLGAVCFLSTMPSAEKHGDDLHSRFDFRNVFFGTPVVLAARRRVA